MICPEHMLCCGVTGGENRNCFNSHLACSSNDSDSDFAAISDQEFIHHCVAEGLVCGVGFWRFHNFCELPTHVFWMHKKYERAMSPNAWFP